MYWLSNLSRGEKIQFLILILVVAILSFTLGVISVYFQIKDGAVQIEIGELESAQNLFNNKRVYASSRGKLYYPWWCESTISSKNIIWFNNSLEATEKGYKLSNNC